MSTLPDESETTKPRQFTCREREANMEACEACESGRWEYGWMTGTPVFVHADGTREVYYECECCADEGEVSA